MDNYELQSDEVVLYKGYVTLRKNEGETQLILTNKNLVFITKAIVNESGEVVNVQTYAVNDIKIYEGQPQIKHKGTTVEIYFLTSEIEFTFENTKEIKDFLKNILLLITGKNTFQRGVEKCKDTINVIDETLGINSVEIAKNSAKMVGSLMLSKSKMAQSATKIVGSITKKKS